MAYVKTTWVNDQTPVNDVNMNHIEDGIFANDSAIATKQDALTIAQLAAANSGIDSTKVAQITTNANNITSLQSSKQDTLIAGTNITIAADGKTISATDTTDYNDLTNKPIINADLSSISGQTTNQVYRHTGTTTASFTQYKLYSYDGTSWSEIGADISGKADKVANATNGNFAGLNASGNLTDSGKKASDFLASNIQYVSSVNGNSGAVTGLEATSNKVTSISASSTDTQYPSAKAVYDNLGLEITWLT